MRYQIIILFLSFTMASASAQEKVEREQKVSLQEVPQVARAWLDAAFPVRKRLKWYLEETSGKTSYEAKFKRDKQVYSVEFSEMGIIEDIEVERDQDALPTRVLQRMQGQFPEEAGMQIRRVQEQWTGSPEALQEVAQGRKSDLVTRRYEVEYTATIDGDDAFWEGTFDADGTLLNYRKIILRPVDNLGF